MSKVPNDDAVTTPSVATCKHCGKAIMLRVGSRIFPDKWLDAGLVFPQYCFPLSGQQHEPDLD